MSICPVCNFSFTNLDSEFGLHLIDCGSSLIKKEYNTLGKRKKNEGTLISPLKKQKISNTENNNKTNIISFNNVDEYDNYLLIVKEGRYKRTGPWKGLKTPTPHICTDKKCARTWKPSPFQALNDDYHCPSCVLHHRNNEERWKDSRLAWTQYIPNTFYVFKLIDTNNTILYKFGRTQHKDPLKRYATKELQKYKMELKYKLRDTLKNTTIIENWWKQEASNNKLFKRHSDNKFHGVSECVEIDDNTFKQMIKYHPIKCTNPYL